MGAPTPELGEKAIIWQDFSQKLHENEKIGLRGGLVSLAPPILPLPRHVQTC